MDLFGLLDMSEQPVTERRQQQGEFAGPATHYIAVDIEADAGKDPRQAIPRLVVDKAAQRLMVHTASSYSPSLS